MAVFFDTLAPPGVVLRAEHRFDRVRGVRTAPMTCVWSVGADGKLTARWVANAKAQINAGAQVTGQLVQLAAAG